MNLKTTLLILLSACFTSAFSQQDSAIKLIDLNHYFDSAVRLHSIDPGCPAIFSGQQIVTHTAYNLSYNELHEQASWVCYELTKDETIKVANRTDNFRVDPLVNTGSADNKDYSKSGYDRGHLAPAGDMSWSEITMSESFYFSNMSPQLPGFNRGIWKSLEEKVRDWAIEYESLYIVTGPVLKPGLKTIGENKVSVPDYYYKVLLDLTGPEIKGIGFIMPNASSAMPLQSFAVSIDSVEKFTGINFYSNLSDDLQKVEETLCITCWDWYGNREQVSNETIPSLDSIKYIKEMPYSGSMENICGDPLFWRIVVQNKDNIEALIKLLDKTTMTKAVVLEFGGYYTVGDIAYSAISELIAGIPAYKLLGASKSKSCGYCVYWNQLRQSSANRKKFKTSVNSWYQTNAPLLGWVKSKKLLTCDCKDFPHPNGGHFAIKK
ncbi:MAG: DNA/RNA non-specific endonuclease [Bacteroidia bacterium]|nr:DNA/RNA non-specific endonuclease [Bacteroidia bacterium]